MKSCVAHKPFSKEKRVTAKQRRLCWVVVLSAALAPYLGAEQTEQTENTYRTPPAEIVRIVDAPLPPSVLVGPTRDIVAVIEQGVAPSIAWLARPMHRLAGFRIDPRNSGPWRSPNIESITLINLTDAADSLNSSENVILAPRGTRLGWPQFSPDGDYLSYAVVRDTGIELWVADLSTGQPRPLTSASLNATWGNPCEWLSDSSGALCRFRMSARGAPPDAPLAPTRPNIQESAGPESPLRTYQDLLTNPHDEELFEYHFTSQIATVALATGSRTAIGSPGLYARVTGAPDSRHLLVERLVPPWSWSVPANRFARSVEIWTRAAETVELVTLPLAETTPIGGVSTGPRNHLWNPSEPATVVWSEAQDDGDPNKNVPHRDILYSLSAPFLQTPNELARAEYRFTNIAWTSDGTALITERDRDTRRVRTSLLYPTGSELRQLFNRSSEDRYSAPGNPLHRPGGGVTSRSIVQDDSNIYLTGMGASADGDRPFIDQLNIRTLETSRLFQTDPGTYETVITILSSDGNVLLTRRESPTEPPNYFVRNITGGTIQPLTNYEDPAPVFRQVEKRMVSYQRADGLTLSATLYLPPGYADGTTVPLLMWAYPREFTTRLGASQVEGSPYRFTTPRGASHLFLLTQGYAILDGPAMPILGDGETANDSYVEQLVQNAQAAVEAVVDMGVADPDRIAVGGHSYGAFMAANLLAHSDLFRAGIARSGAYNRTLTPFGFQNERRTFWEAPTVYAAMSPFFHANRITEPLLLTHGEVDNNSGTFPVQSERLYSALRGHGAPVRYVTLPHESHGYVARESVLHIVEEMLQWCNKHLGVKGSQ